MRRQCEATRRGKDGTKRPGGITSSIGLRRLAIGVVLLMLAAAGSLHAQPDRTEESEGAAPADSRSPGQSSPPVEVREVHVKKDRPDEVFYRAGTRVVLWVKDSAGSFRSIWFPNTELRVFRDSEGTDLIAKHDDAVKAWEKKVERLRQEGHYVSMGRSRDILTAEALDEDEGAAGFYLVAESWALPAAEADALRIAGTVSYVLGTAETDSRRFPDIVLDDIETIAIGEYRIRLANFNTDDGRVSFQLNTSLPISSFRVLDPEGEQIGSITMTFNGRPIVEMPADRVEKPVTVVVEFQKPERRSADFDKEVRVGL